MLVNAICGHMAEFRIISGRGPANAKTLLAVIADTSDRRLPPDSRTCLRRLAIQVTSIDKEIGEASQHIQRHFRSNPVSQRLETIPGIDPVIATAIASSVTDPAIFRSGRGLAPWIGLVPREMSTGGKQYRLVLLMRGGTYRKLAI